MKKKLLVDSLKDALKYTIRSLKFGEDDDDIISANLGARQEIRRALDVVVGDKTAIHKHCPYEGAKGVFRVIAEERELDGCPYYDIEEGKNGKPEIWELPQSGGKFTRLTYSCFACEKILRRSQIIFANLRSTQA